MCILFMAIFITNLFFCKLNEQISIYLSIYPIIYLYIHIYIYIYIKRERETGKADQSKHTPGKRHNDPCVNQFDQPKVMHTGKKSDF